MQEVSPLHHWPLDEESSIKVLPHQDGPHFCLMQENRVVRTFFRREVIGWQPHFLAERCPHRRRLRSPCRCIKPLILPDGEKLILGLLEKRARYAGFAIAVAAPQLHLTEDDTIEETTIINWLTYRIGGISHVGRSKLFQPSLLANESAESYIQFAKRFEPIIHKDGSLELILASPRRSRRRDDWSDDLSNSSSSSSPSPWPTRRRRRKGAPQKVNFEDPTTLLLTPIHKLTWRPPGPGLSLAGECRKHGPMWLHLGFGSFSISKITSDASCLHCHKALNHVNRLGLTNCLYSAVAYTRDEETTMEDPIAISPRDFATSEGGTRKWGFIQVRVEPLPDLSS